MKTSPAHVVLCSTCGRTLNAKGECLACLVRVGFDQPPTEFASRVFGDFEIVQREDGSFWELGRGAMGVTYRAEDKVLKRSVALKVIDAPEAAGDGQMVRDRFLREARAAAAFRHPNVAGVFHFGASPGGDGCYYAMELVEGETLEALVRRDGPLPIKTALEIAVQVTRALIAAAGQGLVHRDLKPGNIMLKHSDDEVAELEVKVIDFGLAKAIVDGGKEMDLTKGGFVGTPAFASPEQFRGAPADARSDIYSLGVTLWYALTGEVPYAGKSIEEIRQGQTEVALPVEQLIARKIPAPAIHLLRRILAVDPVKRPGSARELMEALESCRVRLGFIPPPGSKVWRTGQKFAAAFVGLAVLGAATFLALRLQQHKTTAPPPAPAKSIAVLPFENLSSDKDNAYFTDGVQEEILTRLAKIADLKVISRTSTQHYQSKPANLREIAKQLGVANILEGSVQRADNQVRINVRLINVQTHSDFWADAYDRTLTDIPGVEKEIAKRIAESLQANLSDLEQEALAVKPTKHPEAQDAYLRGLTIEGGNYASFFSRDQVLKACISYEHAVQLDPYFANAWARLSLSEGYLYFSPFDHSAVWRDDAKRALETAQKLEPNSPETLLALGYYQYRVLLDYALAKMTFGRVHKMLPGGSEVQVALSRVARHEGHWDESIAYFEQALTQDPRNLELLVTAAETYTMLRQFPTALKLYDRALDIAPNDPDMTAAKAGIYQAQGSLDEAARVLSEINWQTRSEDSFTVKIAQLRLERNYAEAIRLLQARLAQFHFESAYDKAGELLYLAFMQRVAGDTSGAKVTGEKTRITIDERYRGQPQEELVARMSQAYAATGEKDSALNVAQRAIVFVHAAKDRMQEPRFEENLAFIQTIVGENSSAIYILTQLLQTPYKGWLYPSPVTRALLRLDPLWDPLRADPAFQKLCEEKQP